jgi:hypothetical protein
MGRADQGGRRKRGLTDVRATWFCHIVGWLSAFGSLADLWRSLAEGPERHPTY